MRVYLDDDMASAELIRTLRGAGHDVQVPRDVGLMGKDDPVHLTHTIREQREIITGNYRHFEDLHNLILTASGKHPGILVVRRDGDFRRNLKSAQIVRAIANLQATVPLHENQIFVLNHWR